MQIKSSPSFWSRNGAKLSIFGLLALVVLVFNHSSRGETLDATLRKNAIANSPPMKNAEVRRCLEELRFQARQANMGSSVRHSSNAKYHAVDEDTMAIVARDDIDMNSPKMSLISTNQPHKGFWISATSIALVYPNNMVVSVDIAPTCQVKDVFGPTPQNEVHPFAASQISDKTMVSPDTLCTGIYHIKGVAANAYLNYDTNVLKVATKADNQIDAVNPPDGNYSKWEVEYYTQTVMDGAELKFLYKVLSFKTEIIYKYLSTKSGNEVVAHHTLDLGNTENTTQGLIWQFYQVVKDTAPVAVKLPGYWNTGTNMVMSNVQTNLCLCIHENARYDTNSVNLCGCTDVHAVLVFEATTVEA